MQGGHNLCTAALMAPLFLEVRVWPPSSSPTLTMVESRTTIQKPTATALSSAPSRFRGDQDLPLLVECQQAVTDFAFSLWEQ